MLQDHRQRTSIKTTVNASMESNISLLSISSESNTGDQDGIDLDSQSSDRESSSPCVDESEERRAKPTHIDPYLLDKHLHGKSSTQSTLDDFDIDQSVKDLFATNRCADRRQNDDFEPRSIRPPPFSDYIEQNRHCKGRRTLKQSPSTHSLGRTSTVRPVKLEAQPLSGRSCKKALGLKSPLVFSPFLIEQIRQDIQREPGVQYSGEVHRSLTRIDSILAFQCSLIPNYRAVLSNVNKRFLH